MVKDGTSKHAAQPKGQQGENILQLPPSQSTLSVSSEYDGNSTGYITASSSRVSHLDSEPLTSLPRIRLEHMRSSTPTKRSTTTLPRSPSDESMTTIGGDTSRADNLASLSSVTTFVPSTITDLDNNTSSDEDENAFSDRDNGAGGGGRSNDTEEYVQDWDFDLRDPYERAINLLNNDDDEAEADYSADNDQTLTVREGDVITVSHSHSTSINTAHPYDSIPHSRTPSQPDTNTTHHHHHHSSFPMTLSTSWPSMPSLPSLPPSAVKLHRKRRSLLLRLLKTWEGREQILHFSHSLILLLYSSLDHPVPQTYRGAILRPAGTVLAMSFPKPVRVALMQRIYTTAEGIDNFRRVILIARWIGAASEAVMDNWRHTRQDNSRRQVKRVEKEDLEIKLTGDEPLDRKSDHVEGGFGWLQPLSIRQFDADQDEDEEGGEQSFVENPMAKAGKLTGRGDATGAIGADVAETAKSGTAPDESDETRTQASRSSNTVKRTFARFWTTLWQISHLEYASEALATVGEACETAAVLAGGGMFWRAVGIQRLGLPFLSRRRRQGIERLGIVLSLCSVLLSLLVLRMERKVLRSELRSAHRRIIRANDKLGWASDLAGTTIERDQALSFRKKDPAKGKGKRKGSAGGEEKKSLQLLGEDLQAAARDLDYQTLAGVDESSSSSDDSSSLSDDTWTVVPDGTDEILHTGRSLPSSSSHHHHHHHSSSSNKTIRREQQTGEDGKPAPVSISTLIQSTERSLIRAESDLVKTRRRIKLNFWNKVANWSVAIFLTYEAALPQVDKDGVEGWTGLVASTIRLCVLWKEISWS